MDTKMIYEAVQDRYTLASRGVDTGYGHSIAKSFGYIEEELDGNPLALASLREVLTAISSRT
jgi:arsenite methyltransferase